MSSNTSVQNEQNEIIEESSNSPTSLINERIQTELNEHAEESDLAAIGKELKIWWSFSIVLLLTLILLQIREFYEISIDMPIIPLIINGALTMLWQLKQNINAEMFFNKQILIISFSSTGNILSYLMLIIYIRVNNFYFLLTISPLLFFKIILVFFNRDSYNQCQEFSRMVLII